MLGSSCFYVTILLDRIFLFMLRAVFLNFSYTLESLEKLWKLLLLGFSRLSSLRYPDLISLESYMASRFSKDTQMILSCSQGWELLS